jgi:hypothetical protein
MVSAALAIMLAVGAGATYTPLPAKSPDAINKNFKDIQESLDALDRWTSVSTITYTVVGQSTVSVTSPITGDGSVATPVGINQSLLNIGESQVTNLSGDLSTLSTSISAKVSKTGDTMTGPLIVPSVTDSCNAKYRAAGDGTTDDTAAIQALVSSCRRAYFPAGSYRITGTVTISTDNVSLYGDGRHSVIVKDATMTTPVMVVVSSNVHMTDLNFLGRSGNTGNGLDVRGRSFYADSIGISRMGQDGLRIGCDGGTCNANHWLVVKSSFSNNGRMGMEVDQGGVALPDANAGHCDTCFATFNSSDGFHVNSGWWVTFTNILADHNGRYGLHLSSNAYNATVVGGDLNEGNLGSVLIDTSTYNYQFYNVDGGTTIWNYGRTPLQGVFDKAWAIYGGDGGVGSRLVLNGTQTTGAYSFEVLDPSDKGIQHGVLRIEEGTPGRVVVGRKSTTGGSSDVLDFVNRTDSIFLHMNTNGGTQSYVGFGGETLKFGIDNQSPQTTLDVDGTSQFGHGVYKTTFTRTGDMFLAAGSSIAALGQYISLGTPVPTSTYTATIQAAINAYTTVYLASGTYTIDAPLRLPTGTRLIGAGKAATIFQFTGSTVAFQSAAAPGTREYDWDLRGFTVITGTHTGTTAFDLDAVSRSNWSQVTADGFGRGWFIHVNGGSGTALYNRFWDVMAQNIGLVSVSSGGVGVLIQNDCNANKFYGLRVNNFLYSSPASTGVVISDSNENLFEGSQFETDVAGIGLWLKASQGSVTTSNVVHGSRFEMAHSTAIINGYNSDSTVFDGNFFDGNAKSIFDYGYNTYWAGNGRSGGDPPGLRLGRALIADAGVADSTGDNLNNHDPVGCVAVGTNAFNNCSDAQLDVEGQQAWGTGIFKSTTDTRGGLTLAKGAGLTMQGDDDGVHGFSQFKSRQHDSEVQWPPIFLHKYGGGDVMIGYEVSGSTWQIGVTRQSGYAGQFLVGQGSNGTAASDGGSQVTPATAPLRITPNFEVLVTTLAVKGGLTASSGTFTYGVTAGSMTVVNGLTASSGTFTYGVTAGSSTILNAETVAGTMTVQGNAFSVGSSSFVVTQSTVMASGPYFTVGGSSLAVVRGRVGINTAAPSTLLQILTTDDVFTNLANPRYYGFHIRSNLASNGTGEGICISNTNTDDQCGASIIAARTGSESKGDLRFYTKQSASNAVAPVLAMTLSDTGNVSSPGGLTASSGTFTATGNTQYSIATSSGISVGGNGSVCLSGDCRNQWPTGGGTGLSGGVNTELAYWTGASNIAPLPYINYVSTGITVTTATTVSARALFQDVLTVGTTANINSIPTGNSYPYPSVQFAAGVSSWTVPSGVYRVYAKAWGAGGGKGSAGGTVGGNGGGGSFAKGYVSTTPGEVLTVLVGRGGAGGNTGVGGAGGTGLSSTSGGTGGNGGSTGNAGGGGGAASGLFRVTTSTSGLLVAAGGGGGGAGGSISGNGSSANGALAIAPNANGETASNGGSGTGDGGGGGGGYSAGGSSGTTGGNNTTGGGAGSAGNSFGDVTEDGSSATPGGTSDSDYTTFVGTGATAAVTSGGDGKLVIYYGPEIFSVYSGSSKPFTVLPSGVIATGITASTLTVSSSATFLGAGITATSIIVTTGTDITSVPLPQTIFTGAITAAAPGTLTTAVVGLEDVPDPILVSTISYSVAAVSTAGTYKVCVYSQDGQTKLIDVTGTTNHVGQNTVTVSPPVLLQAGNYYFLVGWATTATSTTLNKWASNTLAGWSTGSPGRALEGTVTRGSGVCDSTLGAISPAISDSPIIRLDN